MLLTKLGSLVNPYPSQTDSSILKQIWEKELDPVHQKFRAGFTTALYIDHTTAGHSQGIFGKLADFDLKAHMESSNILASDLGINCKSSLKRIQAMHRSQKAVSIIMSKARTISTSEEARLYVFMLGCMGINLTDILDAAEVKFFAQLRALSKDLVALLKGFCMNALARIRAQGIIDSAIILETSLKSNDPSDSLHVIQQKKEQEGKSCLA